LDAVPIGPEFRNAEPLSVPVVTDPSQIAPITTGELIAPGVQLLFASAPDPLNPGAESVLLNEPSWGGKGRVCSIMSK